LSKPPKVAVIGLGKLGSCLATVLASNRYSVTGVDINSALVKLISQKKAPFKEDSLDMFLEKSGKYLTATENTFDACLSAEIIFLVLPTPSKKDGSFSLKYIDSSLLQIGAAIKASTCSFPLVVLTSTVMPGDCENKIIPLLEKITSKKCGKGFGFCYNPEFIALGSVIRDMQYPDMVLIGESDKKSGDKLYGVYKTILKNQALVERMSLVNAEIVKLSINTFVTTKISYANMLTQICNEIKGAHIDVVSSAIGRDSRIGNKYLKGGTPFGGPCFPRDNRAFQQVAKRNKLSAFLADYTDRTNSNHLDYIFKQIESLPKSIKKVGILGLSYKPFTPVTEESAGVILAQKLVRKKYSVYAFDPMVDNVTIKIKLAKSLKDLVRKVDLVIIMNPDESYSRLKPSDINKKAFILDCWRILDTKKWAGNKNLISLGIGKK